MPEEIKEIETKEESAFDNTNEEKVLYEWEAAERAYKKRDKDYWITAVAILVLVSIILIFIKEFFLIIALVSILFLYYVLSAVPPQNIRNKITNRAVYFGDLRYEWELLEKFWFKQSLNSEMLLLGTILRFPRQVAIVINLEDKEKIKEIVVKKIPMMDTPPTFVDKLSQWAADRLPLENREKSEDKQEK